MPKKQTITLEGPMKAYPDVDAQQRVRSEHYAGIKKASVEEVNKVQAEVTALLSAGREAFEVASTTNTLEVSPGDILSRVAAEALALDEEYEVIYRRPKTEDTCVSYDVWEMLS